ncbi:propanediol utilization protein [Falsirhodobacter halotolerans]|uniref:propanediol utilization protein n=1 Tax=Falsirhodobacter halotolerans TaxID=1146892 RepID=UPI001FD5CEA6|nr:propanediol utilization protein [Falsirhodobacter halotolerans]MCJ8139028.1 propanediol utilization protein [Falsirhodobacter halotolerans]
MTRIEGHMGELMQGRLGGDVALITLPCPALAVTATHRPGPFALRGARVIRPAVARAVRRTGIWHLRADMPAGGGAGSSTAAILAMAGRGDPDALAALCLRLEGAVDPLMHPRPERLLWASRRAVVLRALPPLPPMRIVGGFLGAGERTDPADTRFPDIADLVAAWCADPSLATVARLASTSAARTQALRGPAQDPTPFLPALGWARAHTGPARALILPPEADPTPARRAMREAGFRHIVSFPVRG